MDERQLGSNTAACPTCGSALEVVTNAGGSTNPVTCLVCYGDPKSAPPAPPADRPLDATSTGPAPQKAAADDALPRELGTDTTAQEG